jgi:hypothetical protein
MRHVAADAAQMRVSGSVPDRDSCSVAARTVGSRTAFEQQPGLDDQACGKKRGTVRAPVQKRAPGERLRTC